jgi:predicted secreted protein
MSWAQGVLTYCVAWWTVWLMVQPLWVRTGERRDPLHHAGAPERPHLRRKAALTSALSLLLTLGMMKLVETGVFSDYVHP